jgi:hypothetical protein
VLKVEKERLIAEFWQRAERLLAETYPESGPSAAEKDK